MDSVVHYFPCFSIVIFEAFSSVKIISVLAHTYLFRYLPTINHIKIEQHLFITIKCNRNEILPLLQSKTTQFPYQVSSEDLILLFKDQLLLFPNNLSDNLYLLENTMSQNCTNYYCKYIPLSFSILIMPVVLIIISVLLASSFDLLYKHQFCSFICLLDIVP